MNQRSKTARYSQSIITVLSCSLDKRFSGILVEPLYCISTMLDPHFKLKCCNEVPHEQAKVMVLAEMSSLEDLQQGKKSDDDDESSQPLPTRMSQLFSF